MTLSWVVGLAASVAAREVETDVALAARSNARVLISGERGLGKAALARIIHARSRRAPFPFVPVRCGSLADTQVERHLFGGPPDDPASRGGAVERAAGGTLLLADIGEAGPRLQQQLREIIESGAEREGAPHYPDVRLIATTHPLLLDRVVAGEFREDLFYRLNILHIHVPPLRQRREDIAVLLTEILARTAAAADRHMPELSADAWRSLCSYDWPGNLAEMRRVAGCLVGQAGHRPIGVHDLPQEIAPYPGSCHV